MASKAWEQGTNEITTKYSNVFQKAQKSTTTILDDDTTALNFVATNNYTVTLTADADITLDSAANCEGQSGTIIINGAEHVTGWGTEFDFGHQGTPDGLEDEEIFGYFVAGESDIKIGRL